ncbi:hypothetical protein EWM64_g5366 [Hericium alpestre]|uniref:DUF7918 domain-containing protein n=1 Tax=Hericium alpestre TaxID=135208 RepID=A0A4Y9ZZ09_9AGAM|nr:hypothetical protein EWM64_g5366 [Hericium alpestre]
MDKIVRVYCDGRYMYGHALSAGRSGTIDSVLVSSIEVKPFTFSHVLTSDDDAASQNNVDISDLGIIEIRIFRVASKNAEALPPNINNVNEIGAVPELSKKGGLHQVSSTGRVETRTGANMHKLAF